MHKYRGYLLLLLLLLLFPFRGFAQDKELNFDVTPKLAKGQRQVSDSVSLETGKSDQHLKLQVTNTSSKTIQVDVSIKALAIDTNGNQILSDPSDLFLTTKETSLTLKKSEKKELVVDLKAQKQFEGIKENVLVFKESNQNYLLEIPVTYQQSNKKVSAKLKIASLEPVVIDGSNYLKLIIENTQNAQLNNLKVEGQISHNKYEQKITINKRIDSMSPKGQIEMLIDNAGHYKSGQYQADLKLVADNYIDNVQEDLAISPFKSFVLNHLDQLKKDVLEALPIGTGCILGVIGVAYYLKRKH